MIVAADTWADFAGDVWADPTTRWVVYAVLVVIVGIGTWRGFRRVRTFLAELRADLGVVKHEVKNDHDTNLRVEADERHQENARKLDSILELAVANTRAVNALTGRLNDLVSRVDIVERTQDRSPQ